MEKDYVYDLEGIKIYEGELLYGFWKREDELFHELVWKGNTIKGFDVNKKMKEFFATVDKRKKEFLESLDKIEKI